MFKRLSNITKLIGLCAQSALAMHAMEPDLEIVAQVRNVIAPPTKRLSMLSIVKHSVAAHRKKKQNKAQLQALQALEPVSVQKKTAWFAIQLEQRRHRAGNLGWELTQAAFRGDFAQCKHLVALGADINAAQPLLSLLFYYRGDHGKYNEDQHKQPALSDDGHEFFQWLINNHANVNAVNKDHNVSVLSLAITLCKEGCCVDRLLEAGASIGPLELGAALASCSPTNVGKLLNQKEPINISNFRIPYDRRGLITCNPFESAMRAGFDSQALPAVLEMLYKSGARLPENLLAKVVPAGMSLEVRDATGRTPLLCTIEDGNPDSVEKLLVHGADPFASDGKGNSGLQIAKERVEKEPYDQRCLKIVRLMESAIDHHNKISHNIALIEELIEGSPVELELAKQELVRLKALKVFVPGDDKQLIQLGCQALKVNLKEKEECIE